MMALERQSKKRSTEALELPQKTRYILSIAACRPTQATAEDYFSDDSFEVRSVSPMSPMANVGTKRSDSDNKALVGSHADYGSIRGLQPANSMDNRGSSVAALVPRPTYWERYQLGLREDKFGTPEGVATDKETFGKLIRAPSEPTQSSSYEDRCHRRRRKCENSERSESRTELESAAHRKQQRSDKEKYKLKSRVTSSRSGCNNVADWPERISVSPAVTSIGSEPANTNSASKRRRTEVAISDGSVRKEQRDIVDVLLEQWTMPMSK
ncbi:hypothetical protein BU25DRAFT_414875 [Macroventuria anomochaeta]|uniref:Uncharacterized protein n=1 Tax=Macroventuria anomochaeta TaxID=301207 RepID=A0ACB6RM74_9PLEO|nr:uncharacterized protein BU25DRAFT_414875 [Macroventuria anomochaeta]KAF2622893.1 hypothetical protein BU25DRAFT_414875 [Macroventuria anomochaeta]